MNDQHHIEYNRSVFLVTVNSNQDSLTSLEYACRFANAERGYVALLSIIEHSPIQNWGIVEDQIRKDLRLQAEQAIWNAAGYVVEQTGRFPMVCIEEGEPSSCVIDTIEGNDNIASLVLTCDSNASPGPLVKFFSGGKGLSRLSVPLIIIPAHINQAN